MCVGMWGAFFRELKGEVWSMFTETNKKLSKGRKNHPRVGILHALIFRLNMRALRIVNRTADHFLDESRVA